MDVVLSPLFVLIFNGNPRNLRRGRGGHIWEHPKRCSERRPQYLVMY